MKSNVVELDIKNALRRKIAWFFEVCTPQERLTLLKDFEMRAYHEGYAAGLRRAATLIEKSGELK